MPRVADAVLAGALMVAGCGGDAVRPPVDPSVIILVSGGGQAADVGAVFAQPVTFRVADAVGDAVKDAVVVFIVSSGVATLDPATARSDAQGLVKTMVTAGNAIGALTIVARAGQGIETVAALNVRAAVGDGRWDGSTGQGLPVYLRVGGGATRVIDTLLVRMTATYGAASCTGTIVKTGIPIGADGRFETALGIGFRTTLRGQFTSATTVSGTIDGYVGTYAAVCGQTVLLGAGATVSPMTWSAGRHLIQPREHARHRRDVSRGLPSHTVGWRALTLFGDSQQVQVPAPPLTRQRMR
jgi:hypothetical protein